MIHICCIKGAFPLKCNFIVFCAKGIQSLHTLICMKTIVWSKKHFKNTDAQALPTIILIQQVEGESQESVFVRTPMGDFDARAHTTWGTTERYINLVSCLVQCRGFKNVSAILPCQLGVSLVSPNSFLLRSHIVYLLSDTHTAAPRVANPSFLEPALEQKCIPSP